MTSSNDQLRSTISKVKNVHAHYAFFTGKPNILLVAPSPITSAALDAAKKECAGSLAASGSCFYEDNALIFQTAGKPPSSLAGAIKKCITEYANLNVEVNVRAAAEETDSLLHPVVKSPPPPQ